jgi:hypothetical protein
MSLCLKTGSIFGRTLMHRRYYTSRRKPGGLTLEDLYAKLKNVYVLFRDKDYFKGRAGITKTDLPDSIEREAAVALTFQLFPIALWPAEDITEDRVFDAIEFLYDHTSAPGNWVSMTTDTGWSYYDYNGYDDETGRSEFRQKVNTFLFDYKAGYELTEEGMVLALGTGGLQHIIDAEIVPYDEANVDSKVRRAIGKWRSRHVTLAEKKEAIRELADVFEWLKKTKLLASVLDGKDESAIFDLANNFAIRHHDPKQKTNYDATIWYSWMFHFYLATYHAAVRLLVKKENSKPGSTSSGRSNSGTT